jgi:hypothetical protein
MRDLAIRSYCHALRNANPVEKGGRSCINLRRDARGCPPEKKGVRYKTRGFRFS